MGKTLVAYKLLVPWIHTGVSTTASVSDNSMNVCELTQNNSGLAMRNECATSKMQRVKSELKEIKRLHAPLVFVLLSFV